MKIWFQNVDIYWFEIYRSQRTGNMLQWCWIAFSYGHLPWPVFQARVEFYFKPLHCTTRELPLISVSPRFTIRQPLDHHLAQYAIQQTKKITLEPRNVLQICMNKVGYNFQNATKLKMEELGFPFQEKENFQHVCYPLQHFLTVFRFTTV